MSAAFLPPEPLKIRFICHPSCSVRARNTVGIVDGRLAIVGRPLVDDVDNAREPVVLYIGVGDLGLVVGVCAAERDGRTYIVSRVAPRPSGVLDHGVVADSQTGDGRARAGLEHHGGHRDRCPS